MNEEDEFAIYNNSKTDKTYVSRALPSFSGRSVRIANKYIDSNESLAFAKIGDEVVLRETPKAKTQIKATFVVEDRSIQTVTIQKFLSSGKTKEYFTFLPNEVNNLLKFLTDIKRVHFPNDGKINITDAQLEDILLSPEQLRHLATNNIEMLAAIARTEITSEDIVALGYRRQQLQEFEKLLKDEHHFKLATHNGELRPEDVWQQFFERNPWIFGLGLSLIYFGPLDQKKLKQTVQGYSITGPGKEVDGLLRSKTIISTTCFVEIKRHDTQLLDSKDYRSGIWRPSSELSGAVAQIQGNVAAALEQWGSQVHIEGVGGESTGEVLHTTEPRSVVVCGALDEFKSESGINARKFRSFERFRRNLVKPEIITFDELFQRASFVVQAEGGVGTEH
jgi:hypothetical protein